MVERQRATPVRRPSTAPASPRRASWRCAATSRATATA